MGAHLLADLLTPSTARLQTIDFGRLVDRNPAEVDKLVKACIMDGFFHLDLTTSELGRDMFKTQDDVLQIVKRYFNEPLEKKLTDPLYVPIGAYAGVKPGSRDSYQRLSFMGHTSAIEKSVPDILRNESSTFSDVTMLSYRITCTILECLSDSMHLKGSDRFEMYHRAEQPAESSITIMHYPANVDASDNFGHVQHTDLGTLSMIFTDQWGLQIFDPEQGGWIFVRPPPPGHATLNVADSLRFLSRNKFKSCVHRVIPHNGIHQDEERYSVAYFLRPENQATFQCSDGRILTGKQWHDEKFAVFEAPNVEPNPMLTGGMEQLFGDVQWNA